MSTWSHLRTLTKIPDEADRIALLDASLAEAWTVNELQRRIDARAEGEARSSDAARPGGEVQLAIVEGTQTSGRSAADLGTFISALEERLPDNKGPLPETLLARAEEVLNLVRARAETALALIELARQSQRRPRLPATDRARPQDAHVFDDDEAEDAERGEPAAGPRGSGLRRTKR